MSGRSRALPNVIEKRLTGHVDHHGERRACPRTHHEEDDPRIKQDSPSGPRVVYVRNGYKAVMCDGEAHSNVHIDNCMACAPMWGVKAVKVGAS